MSDLIKEIEKLKEQFSFYTDYSDGYFDCVDEVLGILDQYNIITAPKEILLSEIVDRLNTNDYVKFEVVKMNNYFLIENTNFYRQYFELTDNKVSIISEEMQIDEFKWLYTLWIAGTTIIDDLEE